MSLYNTTALFNATNPAQMVSNLNDLSGGFFVLALYMTVGISLILVYYLSTAEPGISLGVGGLAMAIIGGFLFFVGWLPPYAPFIFLALSLIGTVVQVSMNG